MLLRHQRSRRVTPSACRSLRIERLENRSLLAASVFDFVPPAVLMGPNSPAFLAAPPLPSSFSRIHTLASLPIANANGSETSFRSDSKLDDEPSEGGSSLSQLIASDSFEFAKDSDRTLLTDNLQLQVKPPARLSLDFDWVRGGKFEIHTINLKDLKPILDGSVAGSMTRLPRNLSDAPPSLQGPILSPLLNASTNWNSQQLTLTGPQIQEQSRAGNQIYNYRFSSIVWFTQPSTNSGTTSITTVDYPQRGFKHKSPHPFIPLEEIPWKLEKGTVEKIVETAKAEPRYSMEPPELEEVGSTLQEGGFIEFVAISLPKPMNCQEELISELSLNASMGHFRSFQLAILPGHDVSRVSGDDSVTLTALLSAQALDSENERSESSPEASVYGFNSLLILCGFFISAEVLRRREQGRDRSQLNRCL